jgi:hypothetical protein
MRENDLLCGGVHRQVVLQGFVVPAIVFRDQIFYIGIENDHAPNRPALSDIIGRFSLRINEDDSKAIRKMKWLITNLFFDPLCSLIVCSSPSNAAMRRLALASAEVGTAPESSGIVGAMSQYTSFSDSMDMAK